MNKLPHGGRLALNSELEWQLSLENHLSQSCDFYVLEPNCAEMFGRSCYLDESSSEASKYPLPESCHSFHHLDAHVSVEHPYCCSINFPPSSGPTNLSQPELCLHQSSPSNSNLNYTSADFEIEIEIE